MLSTSVKFGQKTLSFTYHYGSLMRVAGRQLLSILVQHFQHCDGSIPSILYHVRVRSKLRSIFSSPFKIYCFNPLTKWKSFQPPAFCNWEKVNRICGTVSKVDCRKWQAGFNHFIAVIVVVGVAVMDDRRTRPSGPRPGIAKRYASRWARFALYISVAFSGKSEN